MSPEEPNASLYIARVIGMWEEAGEKLFHAAWLSRGGETVLGETSDPCELFLVDLCEDSPLGAVVGKVMVTVRAIPQADWSMRGGEEEEVVVEEYKEEDGTNFFVTKFYDHDVARFEDIPAELLQYETGTCKSCDRKHNKVRSGREGERERERGGGGGGGGERRRDKEEGQGGRRELDREGEGERKERERGSKAKGGEMDLKIKILCDLSLFLCLFLFLSVSVCRRRLQLVLVSLCRSVTTWSTMGLSFKVTNMPSETLCTFLMALTLSRFEFPPKLPNLRSPG